MGVLNGALRGAVECQVMPVPSAVPWEGVAAGYNPSEPASPLALHLPSHQDLYGRTAERLPGRLPYSEPRLSKIGCPLSNLVAGEDNQLECLRGAIRCFWRILLDPHRCRHTPLIFLSQSLKFSPEYLLPTRLAKPDKPDNSRSSQRK